MSLLVGAPSTWNVGCIQKEHPGKFVHQNGVISLAFLIWPLIFPRKKKKKKEKKNLQKIPTASCMWPSTRKGIKVLKTWSKLEGGQTQITHRFLSKEGKGSLNLSLKSPLMQEQLIGSKGHHTPL